MKKKILFVDDNLVLQKSAKKILQSSGFEVDSVDNGTDAIDLLKDQDYTVVIADYMLPDISGLEVIRQGSQINKKIRWILITAYAGWNIMPGEYSRFVNVVPVLNKPFEMKSLVSFVSKLAGEVNA